MKRMPKKHKIYHTLAHVKSNTDTAAGNKRDNSTSKIKKSNPTK